MFRLVTYAVFFIVFSGLNAQVDYQITVFGTDLVSHSEIRETYSRDFDRLIELYQTDRVAYRSDREELNNQLNEIGQFAYTNLYLFRSYSGSFSFILDFVEPGDAEQRLDYRAIDAKSFRDPDSLIAKWNAYEELSSSLFDAGEISDMSCPVIHCTWSFHHPKLEPFLTYFNEFVPANRDKLVYILHTSDSSRFRSAASFLLAHSGIDNAQLLELLMPSINDPESIVRNNSMRVIYYIARASPQSQIDTGKIIAALDYPGFTDRNKALVILRSLPLTTLSATEKSRLLPILLEILEKKDAHNYKNAHTVIKKISQENFGVDDLDRWKEWVEFVLK